MASPLSQPHAQGCVAAVLLAACEGWLAWGAQPTAADCAHACLATQLVPGMDIQLTVVWHWRDSGTVECLYFVLLLSSAGPPANGTRASRWALQGTWLPLSTTHSWVSIALPWLAQWDGAMACRQGACRRLTLAQRRRPAPHCDRSISGRPSRAGIHTAPALALDGCRCVAGAIMVSLVADARLGAHGGARRVACSSAGPSATLYTLLQARSDGGGLPRPAPPRLASPARLAPPAAESAVDVCLPEPAPRLWGGPPRRRGRRSEPRLRCPLPPAERRAGARADAPRQGRHRGAPGPGSAQLPGHISVPRGVALRAAVPGAAASSGGGALLLPGGWCGQRECGCAIAHPS